MRPWCMDGGRGGWGRGAHFFEDFSHGAIAQSAFRGFVSGETYAIDKVSTDDWLA
jgi:hypothetical protein